MKTILWSSTVIPVTPAERSERRPVGRDPEAYKAMLEGLERHIIWADELGFDAFGSTEHHFQIEGGESVPNNLLFYAKMAALTKNVKLIPLSLVLTARDPLRTAEDTALFSHMFPGRLAVCFARGYQTRWMQTLMQMDRVSAGWDKEADALNREIFDEHLEVLERAWAENSFEHAGKHYQVPFPHEGIPRWAATPWTKEFGDPGDVDEDGTIRRVGVVPKPFEPLEVFIPTTHSRQTIIDAARTGRCILSPATDRDTFRAATELYRDTAREAGHDVRLGQGFGVEANITLGETKEEAFELAVETVGYWFRHFFGLFGFNEGLRKEGDPEGRLILEDGPALVRRMIEMKNLFCGTPEEVCAEFADLKHCYAPDGELEWFAWEYWGQALPPSAHADVESVQRKQLELFADQVKPFLDEPRS